MLDSRSKESRPLTIEDFRGAAAAADDRRREPRFPCDKMIAIRPCRPGEDRGFRAARLLDCSVHGLGLFADESMDAGEQFIVEFKLGGLMLAVYTVRYCRRVAKQYLVGAVLTGFIGGSHEPDAEAILQSLIDAGHPDPA
jgi:hypothetical protein